MKYFAAFCCFFLYMLTAEGMWAANDSALLSVDTYSNFHAGGVKPGIPILLLDD
jgi:hypothetical protein